MTKSNPISTALAATHMRAFQDARPWSADEFAALLESPTALLTGDARSFVLGRVIADEAEILTLATDPDHRRRGHARAALTAFLAAARQRGAISVFLEVAADNNPAHALYAAQGFAQAGLRQGYYARPQGPAVDALILRRDVT